MQHKSILCSIAVAIVIALATPSAHALDRPTIQARTTIDDVFITMVSGTGTLLRGSRWSTDINNCSTPTYGDIYQLRDKGLNALHVYGETWDVNDADGVQHHPNGDAAGAGYCQAALDTLVDWTESAGLYLVLTIGNGHFLRLSNGESIDQPFATAFWNRYAPRYANRPHVIYEVMNEPYIIDSHLGPCCWKSQPSTANITAFESDMYSLIRGHAPNTPILLYSYGLLRDGAAVMSDIASLNSYRSVRSLPAIDWSKTGIAFHGYAGRAETEPALKYVQNNWIPMVQTEFYCTADPRDPSEDCPGDVYGPNIPEHAMHENRWTSWFTFVEVPHLVNDVNFRNQLDANFAWIVWPADYGDWPARSNPPVGRTVSFRHSGLWVSATNNGAGNLKASSSSVGPAEKFDVVQSDEPGLIGLRSQVNGMYVTAENNGALPLIANRSSLGAWEKFTWMTREDGTVVLRAARSNARIVSADFNRMNPPELIANRENAGPWEWFGLTIW